MVIVDHNLNIQKIIDNMLLNDKLFDSGVTVGKLRSIVFGDPSNKIDSSKPMPYAYITTDDSIQETSYDFGTANVDSLGSVTTRYKITVIAQARDRTENSQKQLYNLIRDVRSFFEANPRQFDIDDPPNNPIFARSVINKVSWKTETRGQLVTIISFILKATIGDLITANFPGIGDVILLSKPNAPEGIVFTDDREQKPTPNRVITENGDFGSLSVEYESTVALDDAFRAKFGIEEDVTITTASGAKVYHIQYIDINPTVPFDGIERSILHMEIIPI